MRSGLFVVLFLSVLSAQHAVAGPVKVLGPEGLGLVRALADRHTDFSAFLAAVNTIQKGTIQTTEGQGVFDHPQTTYILSGYMNGNLSSDVITQKDIISFSTLTITAKQADVHVGSGDGTDYKSWLVVTANAHR